MPGPSVHVPLILCAVVLGWLLCGPHPVLWPLMIFWLLAGIYLGRDFAIFCHYALPLALVAWVPMLLLASKAPAVARFGASHVVISALLSLSIGALQLAIAYWFTRKAGS